MPEPLAIPVTATDVPPREIFFDTAFGTRSVVMIASAAASQLSSLRSATAAGNPAMIFATGRGSIITPVENGNTCLLLHPSNRAASAQAACAFLIPVGPVPALALPVLTINALMAEPGLERCSRAIRTGAAQNWF